MLIYYNLLYTTINGWIKTMFPLYWLGFSYRYENLADIIETEFGK